MTHVIDRISELLTQLQSPDFYEREAAVRELGEYGRDEAVAGLVLAIEDPDLGIREIAAEHLTTIGGGVTSQLLISFLAHDDIATRNLAAEILIKIGKDAVPSLIAGLDSDDHDVRKFIVDVLGLIKDDQAVDAISDRLHDSNINVVCSAAEALGEIASPRAVSSLIETYRETEDARLQAVEALGKIGDPETLPELYAILETDDPMILYASIEALGQIGHKDSAERLAGLLNHADRTISEAALVAIINISIAHQGRIPCDLPLDKFTDFLFDGIRNKNEKITRFTLDRLSHWYGSGVLESLLDVLEYVDEDELNHIVRVLGEFGASASHLIIRKLESAPSPLRLTLLDIIKDFVDDEIARQLLPMTEDSDPDVRRKLAHVLGISGSTDVIPALKKLTGDKVGHVRAAAYGALGWLCSEEDVPSLFEGLNDKYGDVREAAMGALILFNGPVVVRRFSDDLYEEDVERQRLAATALGLIGDASVVPTLVRALNHPEPAIRKSAITALARIKEVDNTSPLKLALSDENSSVRKAAASALIAIEGEKAISDIRILVHDNDIWVQYHAINLMGDAGALEFAEEILECLKCNQDILKIAAARALSRMGYRKAIPAIDKLRRDKNEDIAIAAEQAFSILQEAK